MTHLRKAMKKKKSVAQRVHFKNRLKQRFGIEINQETYDKIIEGIQTSKRVKVVLNGYELNAVLSYRAKQSNRVSIYAMILEGIKDVIPVAYDNIRKELITTHPDMLDPTKNSNLSKEIV